MAGTRLGHLRRNVLSDVGPRRQEEREHAKPGHSVPHRLGRTVEEGGAHEFHVRKPNPRVTEGGSKIRLEPLERSAPPRVTAPVREENQARRPVGRLGTAFRSHEGHCIRYRCGGGGRTGADILRSRQPRSSCRVPGDIVK